MFASSFSLAYSCWEYLLQNSFTFRWNVHSCTCSDCVQIFLSIVQLLSAKRRRKHNENSLSCVYHSTNMCRSVLHISKQSYKSLWWIHSFKMKSNFWPSFGTKFKSDNHSNVLFHSMNLFKTKLEMPSDDESKAGFLWRIGCFVGTEISWNSIAFSFLFWPNLV